MIRSGVLFCKSRLSKMASIKTNKNKKRTALLKTNFWWQETLPLGPKWYLHSKGPKNAIYLWLSHDKEHCTFNQQCSWSWLSQRQIAFLGPLEWRYGFGPKDKILVMKSWSLWCPFFVFVWFAKKGIVEISFFQLSTLMSNIFGCRPLGGAALDLNITLLLLLLLFLLLPSFTRSLPFELL